MGDTARAKYQVNVDFDRFKQIYLAQNRRYLLKTGRLCAVIGVVLTLLAGWMMISDFTLENLGVFVLFLAIAVFGIAMSVRPFTFFQTRKNEVYGYFAGHGAEGTTADPLDSLKVAFDVRIEELGFVETLEDRTEFRRPWFTLTGENVECDFGHVFPADDGKNSSMLYNMLGINAYLREGLDGEPLVIPAEALGANPGLPGKVSELVAASRKVYGSKGTSKDPEAMRRLEAWLQA